MLRPALWLSDYSSLERIKAGDKGTMWELLEEQIDLTFDEFVKIKDYKVLYLYDSDNSGLYYPITIKEYASKMSALLAKSYANLKAGKLKIAEDKKNILTKFVESL